VIPTQRGVRASKGVLARPTREDEPTGFVEGSGKWGPDTYPDARRSRFRGPAETVFFSFGASRRANGYSRATSAGRALRGQVAGHFPETPHGRSRSRGRRSAPVSGEYLLVEGSIVRVTGGPRDPIAKNDAR